MRGAVSAEQRLSKGSARFSCRLSVCRLTILVELILLELTACRQRSEERNEMRSQVAATVAVAARAAAHAGLASADAAAVLPASASPHPLRAPTLIPSATFSSRASPLP